MRPKPFYLTARASTDKQTDRQGDSSIHPTKFVAGGGGIKSLCKESTLKPCSLLKSKMLPFMKLQEDEKYHHKYISYHPSLLHRNERLILAIFSIIIKFRFVKQTRMQLAVINNKYYFWVSYPNDLDPPVFPVPRLFLKPLYIKTNHTHQ